MQPAFRMKPTLPIRKIYLEMNFCKSYNTKHA